MMLQATVQKIIVFAALIIVLVVNEK